MLPAWSCGPIIGPPLPSAKRPRLYPPAGGFQSANGGRQQYRSAFGPRATADVRPPLPGLGPAWGYPVPRTAGPNAVGSIGRQLDLDRPEVIQPDAQEEPEFTGWSDEEEEPVKASAEDPVPEPAQTTPRVKLKLVSGTPVMRPPLPRPSGPKVVAPSSSMPTARAAQSSTGMPKPGTASRTRPVSPGRRGMKPPPQLARQASFDAPKPKAAKRRSWPQAPARDPAKPVAVAATQPAEASYTRLAPPPHRREAEHIRRGMVVDFEFEHCLHRGWIHEVLEGAEAFAVCSDALGEVVLEDDGNVRGFLPAELTFTGEWASQVKDTTEVIPVPTSEILDVVHKRVQAVDVSIPVTPHWSDHEGQCRIELGPARPAQVEAVAMEIQRHLKDLCAPPARTPDPEGEVSPCLEKVEADADSDDAWGEWGGASAGETGNGANQESQQEDGDPDKLNVSESAPAKTDEGSKIVEPASANQERLPKTPDELEVTKVEPDSDAYQRGWGAAVAAVQQLLNLRIPDGIDLAAPKADKAGIALPKLPLPLPQDAREVVEKAEQPDEVKQEAEEVVAPPNPVKDGDAPVTRLAGTPETAKEDATVAADVGADEEMTGESAITEEASKRAGLKAELPAEKPSENPKESFADSLRVNVVPKATPEAAADMPSGGQDDHSHNKEKSDDRTVEDWVKDQSEEFGHMPPLPDGWIRIRSKKDSSIYYCNTVTGVMTFTQPTQPANSGEGLPPGWAKLKSRTSGLDYYWHSGTGRTQFDRPLI